MREPVRYQPYWCEENVWHLLDDERLRGAAAQAVVISNPTRSVAMWEQRAALVRGTPVVWDYHVVALARGRDGFEVWDLDCTRGHRLALADWLAVTFGPARDLPPELQPRFRVIDAATWRARLASDRHHMRAGDGRFVRDPPPWPPIGEGEHNLDRFIDMERAFLGEVLDLAALRARFEGRPREG